MANAVTSPTFIDRCAPSGTSADTLDALRVRVPSRDANVDSAELFRLLGEPTRLAILHALLEGGELCVCDLAEVAGASENVVSQALRLLRAADIVRTRREGRRIHYRLADSHVRMLLDVSSEHVRHASHDVPNGERVVDELPDRRPRRGV
jgi:ArsR family transcriptional regulator, lead/cadmium/zinc/bismuth-responsive transcriptional repressor